MPKLSNRSAFMQDFHAATDPVSNTGHRLYEGTVTLLIEERPDSGLSIGENEVYLSSIFSEEKGQGYGTLAMEYLSALGRKHNVDIVLHAAQVNDDGPTDYELVKFYKKHGFAKCGPNNMMFKPANPE